MIQPRQLEPSIERRLIARHQQLLREQRQAHRWIAMGAICGFGFGLFVAAVIAL